MTEENAESPRAAPATAGPPPTSYVAENAEIARGFTNAPISGALFAANIGVFAAQVYLTRDISFVIRAMPEQMLYWLGANASQWTIADSRFDTLVTSCFLHGSILHLAMNLLLVWQIGPLLERAVGSARFFTLYLAAGIVGSAASAIWGRLSVPTVGFGASGALCGVIAAALVVGVRTEGWKSELTIHMSRWLAIMLLVGLIRKLNPMIAQIDNAAHLGGAAAGAVIAITWERGYTYSLRKSRAVIAGCVAVVLGSSALVYIRNKTDPYAFAEVRDRANAGWRAFNGGRCGEATEAMRRASQMDPSNHQVRSDLEYFEFRCADPTFQRAPTNR